MLIGSAAGSTAIALPGLGFAFGQFRDVCPDPPQLKHGRSLKSTFGFRQSCATWPLSPQLGHRTSRTSRGGESLCSFGGCLCPVLLKLPMRFFTNAQMIS